MGIHIPEILLPNNVDMNKWAVVACDQFTSDKNYWLETSEIVDDNPSTLQLILPECFLEEDDKKQRIDTIKTTMSSYINNNIFKKLKHGFILVDRSTPHTPSRKGLIIAIDLEHYSFEKNSKSLIRPTEGTVIERLPSRVEIRENAPLDIPHILLLINDKHCNIIEEAYKYKEEFDTVYNFDLMQNGGKISGHLIKEEKHLENICKAFEDLFLKNEMLFAVGDGNHSLASAKQIWEKLKKSGAEKNHPARFALVEVNNIYNDGIVFEPIHRALFNVDTNNFLEFLKTKTNSQITYTATEDIVKDLLKKNKDNHIIGFKNGGQWGYITIINPDVKLSYEIVQPIIDEYLVSKKGINIDYIHGDKTVDEIGSKTNNLILYFNTMEKSDFFSMIIEGGALPRKTFSIGEAEEKRYYIESRHIS